MLVTCLSQYQFITIQFFSRYSKLNKKPNLVILLVNINNVLKKYIYTFYKKKQLISEQTGKMLSQCMFYNEQYKFITI